MRRASDKMGLLVSLLTRRRVLRPALACNTGTPDTCEVPPFQADCNDNCYPDDCDLTEGTSLDCNSDGLPDDCYPYDCNADGIPDDCDIASGTSMDCDSNGTPDECEPDCNSNGTPDACDIAAGTSEDCNSNAIPDECDIADGISEDTDPANGVPDECDDLLPIARIVSAVTRKDHTNHPNEDISINLNGHVEDSNVTSEMRFRAIGDSPGAIKELRITFDAVPTGPGSNPVTIWQQTGCPPGSQAAYVPYPGSQTLSTTIVGHELVFVFTPGLQNARTYQFRINTSVTRVASQMFELRCLRADVSNNGRVDFTDRSIVIGIWTGSGYRSNTDINLDGATNGVDRSIVVNVWSGTENCAP